MNKEPEALELARQLDESASNCEFLLADAFAAMRLLREQHAEIERLRAERAPEAPPECETQAERTAFAFGWWRAVAAVRAERDAAITAEREACVQKIEVEIEHARMNDLRLTPAFGRIKGDPALRISAIEAVRDWIRARR